MNLRNEIRYIKMINIKTVTLKKKMEEKVETQAEKTEDGNLVWMWKNIQGH